jgi:Uma2 family endonuclease
MQVEVFTNLSDVGPSSIRRLRREEYAKLVELGSFRDEHVELIRGVIVRMAPQGPPHSSPIERLTELLVEGLRRRARVRVQSPLNGPDDSVPEPDLAIVPREDHGQAHPSSALLVIEVSNTSRTYDRETKAPLYAEMGVPELWLVDVQRQCVEVRTDPDQGIFRRVETFGIDDTLALQAFPDLRVPVRAIFSET